VLGIIHREDQGISILDLKGRLTFGLEDLEFRNDVESTLASGKIRLVFNLSGLDELDTTGLGTILFAAGKARDAGGNLAIINSNPSHVGVLIEAQMETTFEVFKSEREAVDSFFPDCNLHPYDILKFVESMKLQHPKA
jgi:anti-sigma B factor antagonist